MKKNLGSKNALYPMPTVIIGTEVDGKVNYITIAHVGILDHGLLAVSMGKAHHSNKGIRTHRTLSINYPSVSMAIETDYIGMVTGAKVDKSEVFESFTGTLNGAPMIKNAPLTMECKVVDIFDTPHFDVFLLKVENTYCDEEVLTDGKIDYSKVDPILFDMPGFNYWRLGEKIADSYSIGKQYKDYKPRNITQL